MVFPSEFHVSKFPKQTKDDKSGNEKNNDRQQKQVRWLEQKFEHFTSHRPSMSGSQRTTGWAAVIELVFDSYTSSMFKTRLRNAVQGNVVCREHR